MTDAQTVRVGSSGATVSVPGLENYEQARQQIAATFGWLGSGQEVFLFLVDRLEKIEKQMNEPQTPQPEGKAKKE